MTLYPQATKKGFTLIEGLVAITIISVAIVAPIQIASQGLRSTFSARDQITAFYLAQDAVEYIRALRDSNKLAGNTDTNDPNSGTYWLKRLGDKCLSPSKCIVSGFKLNGRAVEADKLEVGQCTGSCVALENIPGDNKFGYFSSGYSSRFTRDVTILTPVTILGGGNDFNEARITVTVSWNSGPTTKSIVLIETLRNI